MDIPQMYRDLLRGIGSSVFSVVAEDGSVQSSLVWSDLDDCGSKLWRRKLSLETQIGC